MIGHPLKVWELLDEIARGEVLLPEIPAYVWKGPQVTKVIVSLYQGHLRLSRSTTDLPITKTAR